MRAAPILWDAAGRPAPRRDTRPGRGQCYWCASPIDGQCCNVTDVITDSFTDQDVALARSSPLLCVGCAWSMTGRPPDTLRLWSVAWTEESMTWPANHPSAPKLGDSIHLQNKADPSGFRALLRQPPAGRWCCSIADSGQIHTAPFALINAGGGRYGVRHERVDVWTSAAEYRRLDDLVARLLAAGFTKRDIEEEPLPSRLVECGLVLYRQARTELRPYKGGALLDLVLFLARKETT